MHEDLADVIRRSPDFEKRMAAARARSHWEIGDEDWADTILSAFLEPDEDMAVLAQEKEE
jgi:hypothetical protein